jgi:hypothetical protein
MVMLAMQVTLNEVGIRYTHRENKKTEIYLSI